MSYTILECPLLFKNVHSVLEHLYTLLERPNLELGHPNIVQQRPKVCTLKNNTNLNPIFC